MPSLMAASMVSAVPSKLFNTSPFQKRTLDQVSATAPANLCCLSSLTMQHLVFTSIFSEFSIYGCKRRFNHLISQLQLVSTTDLYYICQMVDGVTRNPGAYLRKIEDIFGDMSSCDLVRKYPKWTCFHDFIETLISSVIFEDAARSEGSPGKYWVDYLLRSNGIGHSSVNSSQFGREDGYEYLDALQQEDLLTELCETISKQVFHVLFSNRGTMSAFGHMVGGYVLDTAPLYAPAAFNEAGFLLRTSIPTWAESAVFHRDKGRCVLCRTDLTKLFSQQSQIHYDHIVPLAHGGMNCVTNLQLTCSSCNLGKGARSAATSREYESWYNY